MGRLSGESDIPGAFAGVKNGMGILARGGVFVPCLFDGHPGRVHSSLSSVFISLFNPRFRSLVRGTLLVLASLGMAFFLSDFPHNRPTPLLAIPAIIAMVGTADTLRCMQPRWSFYHGGVLLCVYMDLMAVSMILFFFLYPYTSWLTAAH